MSTPAYRVLARKYRPQSFDDLIGQEPMVRTLRNAFETGRIHQAYLFTGVRGVGKTTTARIIARALNFESEDGSVSRPTIDMPGMGRHCQAIIDSRHVDVIEMDAASNTSVNDVREIIEAVRYRPASARYKVYIIDEVHMLSGSAFNALLKTLEEPPEHVKFLFATTEIRKVPVTVLSRCQRFDLRRIEADMMMRHLAGICMREEVRIDEDALAAIVRAGEGSVRDSLSMLDQAIAYSAGGLITADQVRAMLGLADRGRMIDLFGHLMAGDIAAALDELAEQYRAGADPATLIVDLAEYVHAVTRLKIAPKAASSDPTMTEAERQRGQRFAESLTIRVLTRAWQILLKGLPEVQMAPRPIVAAEMLLVRLAYAADLPTPDEALRMLAEGGAVAVGGGAARTAAPDGGGVRAVAGGGGGRAPMALAHDAGQPRPVQRGAPPAPTIAIASMADLAALAAERRDAALLYAIETDLRPIAFEPGRIEFGLRQGADPGIVQRLQKALFEWTGARIALVLSNARAGATIRERRAAAEAAALKAIEADPTVKAVLDAFPGAKIRAVRRREDETKAEAEVVPDLVGALPADGRLDDDAPDLETTEDPITDDDL